MSIMFAKIVCIKLIIGLCIHLKRNRIDYLKSDDNVFAYHFHLKPLLEKIIAFKVNIFIYGPKSGKFCQFFLL